jgi:hypothetical protein
LSTTASIGLSLRSLAEPKIRCASQVKKSKAKSSFGAGKGGQEHSARRGGEIRTPHPLVKSGISGQTARPIVGA